MTVINGKALSSNFDPTVGENPDYKYTYEIFDFGNFISAKKAYDSNGNLVEKYFYKVFYDGNIQEAFYSGYSKDSYEYDENGNETAYSSGFYNNDGQILEYTEEESFTFNSPNGVITYDLESLWISYDEDGNISEYEKYVKENDNRMKILDNNDVQIGHIDITYSTDANNNTVATGELLYNGFGGTTYLDSSYSYTFDSNFNIIEEKDYEYYDGNLRLDWESTFNSAGDTLTQYSYYYEPDGTRVTYWSTVNTYDANGKLISAVESWTNPDTNDTGTANVQYNYLEDTLISKTRIIEDGFGNQFTDEILLSDVYEYDPVNGYVGTDKDELININGEYYGSVIASGGAGNDTILGKEGNDTIYGGPGDDSIEGGFGDDILYGEDGNDGLEGNEGNDTLSGGAGSDSLYGGAGDDVYIINDSNDSIIENTDGGTDTVESSISYTLDDNVENLELTGSADLQGIGNELNNEITGNSGNNILYGDTGIDTLSGMEGDDVYILNNADVIIESSGNDTVYTSLGAYTLADGVENLNMIGYTYNSDNETFELGTFGTTGFGNSLDNKIIGNHLGFNTINGIAGNDTLIGDFHYGDTAYEGSDLIYGGDGNDILYAGTDGSFSDTLNGGTGDDIYVINHLNQQIVETSGNDTVYSSLTSYTMEDGIENLNLTGYKYNFDIQQFTEYGQGINATGNNLDNYITGNALANVLSGEAGNDSLIGGSGNDTYEFGENDGIDVIYDELGANDKIYFESNTIKDTAVFYKDGSNLYIDYGTTEGTDLITVNGEDSIERIELANGEYLTNADVNQVIQDIIAYANDNSIAINSFDDVRNNSELMNIVTSGWNAA